MQIKHNSYIQMEKVQTTYVSEWVGIVQNESRKAIGAVVNVNFVFPRKLMGELEVVPSERHHVVLAAMGRCLGFQPVMHPVKHWFVARCPNWHFLCYLDVFTIMIHGCWEAHLEPLEKIEEFVPWNESLLLVKGCPAKIVEENQVGCICM